MKAIIVSASSDIGAALARHWLAAGHEVLGTYRTRSQAVDGIEEAGARLLRVDLADTGTVRGIENELAAWGDGWDVLVMASGTQDPVAPFCECDFDEWARSLDVNFVNQLRLLHRLLPVRNRAHPLGPLTILFAGGGTNNATANYSAYTVSKIALIKMTELLDFEVPDSRFVIVGPGWVKTKIHQSTLEAGERAGSNYQRTLEKLAGDECVPIDKVVEMCEWAISSPRSVIGGRNVSLVFDDWGNPELDALLVSDPDMYKLRRAGNDRLQRPVPISEKSLRESAG